MGGAAVTISGLRQADLVLGTQTETQTLSLPDLAHAGRIDIDGPVSGLDLSSLRTVDELTLHDLGPQALELPSLGLGSYVVLAYSDVTSLSAPLLVRADELGIVGNPQLQAVNLPWLVHATSYDLLDNPSWPACDADALVTQLGPGTSGNCYDNQGTCGVCY